MHVFKKYSFYLWLLPIYYLLHNSNELFGFISFSNILVTGAIIYSFTGVLYCLFYFVLRSSHITSLTTFLCVFLNLYFGHLHDFSKSIAGFSFFSSYKFLITSFLFASLILIVYLKRRMRWAPRITAYLNTLIVIFLLIDSSIFIDQLSKYQKDQNLVYAKTELVEQYKTYQIADSAKPDIFFIVFDSYTNNKTLKDRWDFKNDSITNWLTGKGFYIPNDSKSNYNFTPFSLSSTFNMNYVDEKIGTKGDVPTVMLKAAKSLSENQTFSILEKEGYKIRFFAPFQSKIEDISLLHEFGDMANKQLTNSLLIKRLERDALWNLNFRRNKLLSSFAEIDYNNKDKRRQDVAQIVKKLKDAASDFNTSNRPKFVYAHFMVTHEPYLFDATGNPLNENAALDTSKAYLQQIQYANRLIKDVVTCIKTHGKNNTVIIIAGDHGFRNYPEGYRFLNFPIFSAFYFPSGNPGTLYNSISLVNFFRVVFNQTFHQNFPLLKDSTIEVKYW